jgi:hypothetical protein
VVVSDVREELTEGGFEEDPELTRVEAIQKDGGEAIYAGCDATSARRRNRVDYRGPRSVGLPGPRRPAGCGGGR